ncbi:MAG: type II toxin-antitoxin system HicB family antitoxin [Caldilineales bacterium]|nr:type II toxin-antitoxin system HicB family antitoxin [Caldilineales bacterium]MCW5856659.1 type II toxin-antitoxin system HicB family antitoxin [Caldilineales bacterium]
MRTFTAYIEFDPETSLYVGVIPGISGAHSQGATLDELNANLREVLELCLEELDESFDKLPRFVGLQQLEMAQ